MRPVRAKAAGVPLKMVVGLGVILLSTTAVGAVGTLWAMGKIELPFLSRPVDTHPGMVAIIRSPHAIPAYTKLTLEHLLEATGKPSFHYLPPEQVKPGTILDVTQIIGRVLNHDKAAGYAFTEKDFYEKGTRAGLVGGIPPGKVMMTLDATKIEGLFNLQRGDHIDLRSTYQLEAPKGGSGGKLTSGLQTMAQIASMNKRAQNRLLAEDAVLVTPVTIREKPTISHSVQSGTKVVKVPVQEIEIAVTRDEVDRINEAIVTEVKITAQARSGQPGEGSVTTSAKRPADPNDPMSNYVVLDLISGNKRESVVVPSTPYQTPSANPITPAARRPRHRAAQIGRSN